MPQTPQPVVVNPSVIISNNNNSVVTTSKLEVTVVEAVQEGNLPLLQVLLGEKLYCRVERAKTGDVNKIYLLQKQLWLAKYTALETATNALLLELKAELAEMSSRTDLTECLAMFTQSFGRDLDHWWITVPQLAVSERCMNAANQAYQTSLKTTLEAAGVKYIDVKVGVVRGGLSRLYKEVVSQLLGTLPAIYANELFQALHQLAVEAKAKVKYIDTLVNTEEKSTGETQAANDYRGLCKTLGDKGSQVLVKTTSVNFNGTALREWETQGCPPVSLAVQSQDGSLLEVLCQKETVNASLVCVHYLVEAHLAENKLEGLQQLFLNRYNYRGGFINHHAFDAVFQTLQVWYERQPLLLSECPLSLFEQSVMGHSDAYLKGERRWYQVFLDKVVRNQETLNEFTNQSKLANAVALLSNQTQADEGLAVTMLHIFGDMSSAVRFFHPHKELYEQALVYQEKTKEVIDETIGYVSALRQQQLKDKQKSKRRMEKMAKQKDQVIETQVQALGQKDQALERKDQALTQGANMVATLRLRKSVTGKDIVLREEELAALEKLLREGGLLSEDENENNTGSENKRDNTEDDNTKNNNTGQQPAPEYHL